MAGTLREEVAFPTDDEADGMVRIAWRGPSALVSHYDVIMMSSRID